jgi:hypothetical protein
MPPGAPVSVVFKVPIEPCEDDRPRVGSGS